MPAKGGKPGAAVFRQACLVGKVPRSVLGDLVARVAPVSRSVRWKREAHIYISPRRRRPEGRASGGADETTLKGDPRPMGQARATLGTSKAQPIGRGGGKSPKPPLRKRNAQRQRRRARRVNDFEGRAWGRFSHTDPSGASRRGWCLFLCRC